MKFPENERYTWHKLSLIAATKLIYRHKRRAIKLGLSATLTAVQWIKTTQHFDELCAYCQETHYTVLEHFIPLSKGGGTTFDNCVPACQSCNVIKSQRGLSPEIIGRIQAYLFSCANRGVA